MPVRRVTAKRVPGILGSEFTKVENPLPVPGGSYSTAEKAEIKKATREIDAHLRKVKK